MVKDSLTPLEFLGEWPRYRGCMPSHLHTIEALGKMLLIETDPVKGRKRTTVVTFLHQKQSALRTKGERKAWLDKCGRLPKTR